MSFEEFLIRKYPLFIHQDIKPAFTVAEWIALVSEWQMSNLPQSDNAFNQGL